MSSHKRNPSSSKHTMYPAKGAKGKSYWPSSKKSAAVARSSKKPAAEASGKVQTTLRGGCAASCNCKDPLGAPEKGCICIYTEPSSCYKCENTAARKAASTASTAMPKMSKKMHTPGCKGGDFHNLTHHDRAASMEQKKERRLLAQRTRMPPAQSSATTMRGVLPSPTHPAFRVRRLHPTCGLSLSLHPSLPPPPAGLMATGIAQLMNGALGVADSAGGGAGARGGGGESKNGVADRLFSYMKGLSSFPADPQEKTTAAEAAKLKQVPPPAAALGHLPPPAAAPRHLPPLADSFRPQQLPPDSC